MKNGRPEGRPFGTLLNRFGSGPASDHEVHRVLGLTIQPNLVVQVRAGGDASATHLSDHLPTCHLLSDTNQQFRSVPVSGDVTESVIDLDYLSQA